MRGVTKRAEGIKRERPESSVSSRLIDEQTMVTSCTSGESEFITRLKRKEWGVHGHGKGAEKLERLCGPSAQLI